MALDFFELDGWSFSGVWVLGFGAFKLIVDLARAHHPF